MSIFTNIANRLITDVKRVAGVVRLGDTSSVISSVSSEVGSAAGSILLSATEQLSISGMMAFSERVFDSTAINWNLESEAKSLRTKIEGQIAAGINTNVSLSPIQTQGSESAISDLLKMAYKEFYVVYKDVLRDSDLVDKWKEILFIDDDLRSGLNARVFVNDQTKEINISFEGSHGFTKILAGNALMTPLFKDISDCSDGFTRAATEAEYQKLYDKWGALLGADGVSDLQMLSGKIPDQFYKAYAWFSNVQDKLNSDYSTYKQVISGHSLGGAMSQLVSAKYYLDTGTAIPTIAFEGPGVLSQIEKMAGRDFKPEQFSNIINFVTEGDLVGEFQKDNHVGLFVPIPYTLSRNENAWSLPNYRAGLYEYQVLTGGEDIRIDRHEPGQQLGVFDGTELSYPQNTVLMKDGINIYHGTTTKNELVMGTNGNDTIYAGNGNDIISGAGGDNIIYGGLGNQYIYGGTGNDQIYCGSGTNIIYGGSGEDVIVASKGNNKIYGGDGNDTVIWSGGNDLLYGQQLDDTYILGSVTSGIKARGNVDMKFDREGSGNDHVVFNVAAIDGLNSKFTFQMTDHILPSDFAIKQDGSKLLIQYDTNASIAIDNWTAANQAFGNHITFKFGTETLHAEYKINNGSLIQVS